MERLPSSNARAPVEKELKVRLPHRLIVKLHSLKILEGRPIRDTLAAALDAYYARPDVRDAMGAADQHRDA